MLTYIARRIGAGAVLFLVTSFITYWLLSGSFESVIVGRLGPAATAEDAAAALAQMGLDRPIIVQYLDWLRNLLLHGDLGRSVLTQEVVAPGLWPRIAVTLSVVVPAMIASAIVAVLMGVWAAYRGGWIDKVLQGLMMFGTLVPTLLIAIALVLIFAINLRWLPATGFVQFGADPGGWVRHLILPVIALFFAGAANIATQIRGTMIDELRKDYVRTLRTAGVSPKAILLKHALRNAAGPGVTIFGMSFIGAIGGAMMIELIFALPGIGSFAVRSSMQGDFTVQMGLVVVGVILTIGTNLIIDLANGLLNPKARMY